MPSKTMLKITEGSVSQRWEKGKFVGQSFSAGDQCSWEDDEGNNLDVEPEPEYEPYIMIKESTRLFLQVILGKILADKELLTAIYLDSWKSRKSVETDIEDALQDLKF